MLSCHPLAASVCAQTSGAAWLLTVLAHLAWYPSPCDIQVGPICKQQHGCNTGRVARQRIEVGTWLLTLRVDSSLPGACRDGYTDLRGKFDYVTLTSTADMSSVVRYSLLVASRDKGAVMLQASPPPK